MHNFGDNVPRLMGLHRLTGRDASQLLDVSPQTISEWAYNKRDPNLQKLLMLADFFEVPGDRLMNARFEDLLANELADPDRYLRVQEKITRARRHLRALKSDREAEVGTGKRTSKPRPGVDKTTGR